ncbi:histidinol-phosphatase [soil metagenome]
MNDRDSAALLSFAQQQLDETDAILERHFNSELEVTEKPDRTLVTAADRLVETVLRTRLADAFPGHGFVGEEYGTEEGRGEARWIIDPLDATHNFVRGIPIFATLLALEREGELVLGVASAPALGQRWWASAGGGAFTRLGQRERPIRVSAVERLGEAQLLFGTLRTIEDQGHLPGWLRALSGSWRDRGFGDFWGHMLVAQGSAEAMLDLGVSVWDMAAPCAILMEAGGRMTDLAGRVSWTGPDVLTSNGLLHDELLEVAGCHS